MMAPFTVPHSSCRTSPYTFTVPSCGSAYVSLQVGHSSRCGRIGRNVMYFRHLPHRVNGTPVVAAAGENTASNSWSIFPMLATKYLTRAHAPTRVVNFPRSRCAGKAT